MSKTLRYLKQPLNRPHLQNNYRIRPALPTDSDSIVAFTIAEAHEAEGEELEVVSVKRGVCAAFRERPPARYWVAESPTGELVASTSIFAEWSNFRGGWYWWVQSMFVAPEHRGSGLVDQLLERLAYEAKLAGALELRLYAHRDNTRALSAYRRSGFRESPYVSMSRPLEWARTDASTGMLPNDALR